MSDYINCKLALPTTFSYLTGNQLLTKYALLSKHHRATLVHCRILDQVKILTLSYKQQDFWPEDASFVYKLMDGFEIEIDFADFSFHDLSKYFRFSTICQSRVTLKRFFAALETCELRT